MTTKRYKLEIEFEISDPEFDESDCDLEAEGLRDQATQIIHDAGHETETEMVYECGEDWEIRRTL